MSYFQVITTILTTGTDDWHFNYCLSASEWSEGSSVPVITRWLWPGNRAFLEVANMVVTWRITAFWHTGLCNFQGTQHKCLNQVHDTNIWLMNHIPVGPNRINLIHKKVHISRWCTVINGWYGLSIWSCFCGGQITCFTCQCTLEWLRGPLMA